MESMGFNETHGIPWIADLMESRENYRIQGIPWNFVENLGSAWSPWNARDSTETH